jgi:predicted nucleotidyltransferase
VRGEPEPVYYKFFADEGMKLIQNRFPGYTVFNEPLQTRMVGVKEADIKEVRKPDAGLKKVLKEEPDDVLLMALQDLFSRVSSQSGLKEENFGVFGSLLHGFYHPRFSDLDFIVYGKENLDLLCAALDELYRDDPLLRNEFDSMNAISSKDWKFLNYSLEEYVWHQKRKMIYAYFDSSDAKRIVKAEFEPVKSWTENVNTYNPHTRITRVGWIKAVAEITDDTEAPFIPSVYPIEVKDVLVGPEVGDVTQIFSYMEEYRMQARRGETVLVEGNLERVVTGTDVYHQITLSYGPRYYEQTLKVINE